jgi:hypothetical protein
MELRDLLIKNISKMTNDNIVNVVVDRALLEGWIGSIVAQLPRNPATAAELDVILAQLRNRRRSVRRNFWPLRRHDAADYA